MKITKVLLICVCCVLATSAWGQTAKPHNNSGILGFLDPHTGAFRPVPVATEDGEDGLAATTFTGTVNITITITLKTTAITNISCFEDISVVDGTTSPRFFSETNVVAATGTGTTRTCKLSIPYSWSLTTQSTDNMTTGYGVTGLTGTVGLPERTSGLSPLDVRKVPANGTITALTAAVTI